jgi:serine/threonine protein kinase
VLGNEALTVAGAFAGTPSYMPPEMALGTEPIDARADIYALGCLFFEMLVGSPPFGGRNLFEQMSAHLNQPPPLHLLPPTTPPAVAQLIERMLIKDRDGRLGTLTEAIAVLDGRAAVPPTYRAGPGPGPGQVHPTAIVDKPRGSSGWIIAVVAIILVGAGVAAAIALT